MKARRAGTTARSPQSDSPTRRLRRAIPDRPSFLPSKSRPRGHLPAHPPWREQERETSQYAQALRIATIKLPSVDATTSVAAHHRRAAATPRHSSTATHRLCEMLLHFHFGVVASTQTRATSPLISHDPRLPPVTKHDATWRAAVLCGFTMKESVGPRCNVTRGIPGTGVSLYASCAVRPICRPRLSIVRMS